MNKSFYIFLISIILFMLYCKINQKNDNKIELNELIGSWYDEDTIKSFGLIRVYDQNVGPRLHSAVGFSIWEKNGKFNFEIESGETDAMAFFPNIDLLIEKDTLIGIYTLQKSKKKFESFKFKILNKNKGCFTSFGKKGAKTDLIIQNNGKYGECSQPFIRVVPDPIFGMWMSSSKLDRIDPYDE